MAPRHIPSSAFDAASTHLESTRMLAPSCLVHSNAVISIPTHAPTGMR